MSWPTGQGCQKRLGIPVPSIRPPLPAEADREVATHAPIDKAALDAKDHVAEKRHPAARPHMVAKAISRIRRPSG